MVENQTSAFLGNRFSWSKIKIELDDVQPLHGGIKVHLPGWTMGQAFVTRVAPGGKETKYKILLWQQEKEQICQLCVDHDFLTIEPENRAGVPDEARPAITLTKQVGEIHTTAKWAGIEDVRFDAIYDALRQIGERTKGKKPIPTRLRPYQKILFALGLIILILASLLLANKAAGIVAASWWPIHPGRLAGLIALLIIGMPPVLLGFRQWEHGRPHHDRMGTNPVFLILLNSFFFVGIVTMPAFLGRTGLLLWGETAVAHIQSLSPATNYNEDTGWLTQYKVTYTFQLESGKSFTRQQNISQSFFTALNQDDRISVTYSTILPRFSLPENTLTDDDYAILVLTAILTIYLLIVGARLTGQWLIQFIDERF